jgi:hypothetical protein
MASGMGRQRAAGKAPYSASAPWPAKTATRVPGGGPFVPGPSASTVPASSIPGVKGSCGMSWYWPRIIRRSAKFSPAAAMRTSASPGAGIGTGSSASTGSLFGAIRRRAFMVRIVATRLAHFLRRKPLNSP